MVWIAIALFVGLMVGVGLLASRSVRSVEDYAVAGRRLGLPLAVPTLLATWFGAGTLMTAADEVAASGIHAAALDPVGAGVCLLLAGVLLAGPLWRMKLTTLPEFFGRMFGTSAEVWSSILMIPGYIGWIAVQFTVLADMLTWMTGIHSEVALLCVAVVGIGYTLLGGMWAVTATDVVQMALVVVGLLVLTGLVLGMPGLDAPFARAWGEGTTVSALGAAFLAGSLGNLPGQDLTQRIFAAKSARVAQAACLIAGVAYLVLGMIPVFLALAARDLLPILPEEGVLLHLADAAGHPAFAIAFAVTVGATVLSTIDSAILAPATVLARNLLARRVPETLGLHRLGVLLIGVASLVVAYWGESAWGVLELSYELGMVTLLVPLLGGIYAPRGLYACLGSMAVGTGLWVPHQLLYAFMELDGFLLTPVPVGLGCMLAAVVTYVLAPRDPERFWVAAPIAPQQVWMKAWVFAASLVAASWMITMLLLSVMCFL